MLKVGDKFRFKKDLINCKKYGNIYYINAITIGDLTIKKFDPSDNTYLLANNFWVTPEMHQPEEFTQSQISLTSLLKHED